MTLDRRSLLAFFASSGLGHTLLLGVLWAQIQPVVRQLNVEMVREAARLAGLNWTDEECQDLLEALSSFPVTQKGLRSPR